MILRAVSILLISLTLFQPIYSVCVWLDFEVNRDYISTYLCENKNKPELECGGKCYLMQKLQKAAEDNEQQKEKKPQHVKRIEISELPHKMLFKFKSVVSDIIPSVACFTTLEGFSHSIFHPPQFTV